MFDEQLVLGVDPGIESTGVAVVTLDRRGAKPVVEHAVTVRTPPGARAELRLRRIHEAVASLLAEHRPATLALERLMWGRNTGSAMQVARASGVIALAAAQAGVRVEEYAPLEVKMAVTGSGNAPKDAVRRGLTRLLGVEGVPSEPDAADAVAVAVCHLQQGRLRAVAGAAR